MSCWHSGAQTWWQGLLLAMLLGLFAAEIGFNIQHDGGHQAYSNVPWINKLKLTSWFFGFRALCCS